MLRRGEPRPAGGLKGYWFLALGLASGIVLRIAVIRSILTRPDSDEAVGILMARHLAHGQFRTFLWGNNYGGALAAVVEAPLIGLFGHAILVARVANTVMTLVAALVVRSIGRRLTGHWAGDVAAVGFWLFPTVWLWWSTRDYEFWVPGLLVALLTVWACLRWDDEPTDSRLWPIGLLAGLTFWEYPLLGCVIVPALAAVAWANRHRVGLLLKMLALAPLGAAPWLLTNLGNGFASLHSQMTVTEGFVLRAEHAITALLPAMLLGGNGLVLSKAVNAATGWAVMVAAGAFTAAHARRNVRLALAGVPVLVWPLLMAAAKVPVPAAAFRYAFVVLPSLVIMAGWAVSSLRWKTARAATAVLLAVLAVVATIRTYGPPTGQFRAASSTDPTLVPLIQYLESTGANHVYANYWIAYVLTLDTTEHVTASDPSPIRYAPYADAARAEPKSTYVYRAGYYTDTQLQKWTTSHHEGQRTIVGAYAVYQFDRPVEPRELPLFVDPA